MNLRALTLCSALLLAACGSETETVQTVDVADAETSTGAEAPDNAAAGPTGSSGIQQGLLTIPNDIFSALPEKNATRTALFGDLHVHTTYSFDAFAFGTLATPYDAYRYALGDTIQHPAGFDMTLRVPLDFYAVTDHAMYLGVSRQAADPSSEIARIMNLDYMENLNAPENLIPGLSPQRARAFSSFLGDAAGMIRDGTLSKTWYMTLHAMLGLIPLLRPNNTTSQVNSRLLLPMNTLLRRTIGAICIATLSFATPINFRQYRSHDSTVKIQKIYGIGWMACAMRELNH